jgi:hypothetical protein
MSASLSGVYSPQEFTDVGDLGIGLRLYTYVAGTTTFKTAYTDVAGTISHTYTSDGIGGQYIALNARGELPSSLFLTLGAYDLCLKRADGSTVWTRFAQGDGDASAIATTGLLAQFAGTGGSALFGFLQAGVGAVGRTGEAKLRERVSLEDYGGVADWTGTGTDNLAAFNAAVAALPSTGGTIELGHGIYGMTAPTISPVKHIRVLGKGSSEASNDPGASEIVLISGSFTINSPKCSLMHLNIRGATGHAVDGVVVGGVAAANVNGFSAHDVGFYQMGRDGLRIGSDLGVNANNFHLSNCRFVSNVRHGYYISDKVSPTLPDANGGTIVHCFSQSNGGDGARFGNANLNTTVGGIYETNTGCGVRFILGAKFNRIVGGDYEGNSGTANISLETGSVYNFVSVNTLYFSQILDTGTLNRIDAPDISNAGWIHKGYYQIQMGHDGGANNIIAGSSTGTGSYGRLLYGPDTTDDAHAHVLWGSAGLRLGQQLAGVKMGLFGTNPVVQPTTASAAATFVAGAGTAVNDASTFDGYTLKQIVKALRTIGALA